MAIGATPRAAAEQSLNLGPVSRLAREVGPAFHARIVDAIEQALAPLAAADRIGRPVRLDLGGDGVARG